MLLLAVPPVKSFLTCLPERLQGLGSPHLTLRGVVGKGVCGGVLEELCGVEASLVEKLWLLLQAWGCRSGAPAF